MKIEFIILFLLIVFILTLVTIITLILVSRRRKKLGAEVKQLKKLNAAVSGINIR
ncbi:MAG TPA: hypothetical protein PK357_01075 [Candidatus Pacearchaeota archaeon]|nr:hypothetical protein [Candidatus Pacearchaeota archaeon]